MLICQQKLSEVTSIFLQTSCTIVIKLSQIHHIQGYYIILLQFWKSKIEKNIKIFIRTHNS